MKTALIAAGALTTAALAGASDVSAKDVNFALTFGDPQGYVQIGKPGPSHGPSYVHKAHAKKKKHKHAKRYWNGNPGYGYGYGGPNPRPRAYGYCATSYQIRARLNRHGWHGFHVRKRTPRFLIGTGYRSGAKYSLKVDRCSGYIANAKPVGGYRYGIYR
ncbi:MAG: hypothetical protein MPJ78_03065 [Hyphomicrobiaceae bacterium]|nr:hypothetical protein [Hyphomicrobiaceae bacterium]